MEGAISKIVEILTVSQSLEERFRQVILEWVEAVERNILWLLSVVRDASLIVARASYSVMLILGVILWAAGVQRYLARRLIIGGSILALVTEILLG